MRGQKATLTEPRVPGTLSAVESRAFRSGIFILVKTSSYAGKRDLRYNFEKIGKNGRKSQLF